MKVELLADTCGGAKLVTLVLSRYLQANVVLVTGQHVAVVVDYLTADV